MIEINDTVDELPLSATEEKAHTTSALAVRDYINGLKKWNLWLFMAYAEIRRRYRRTLIGPFWTTLSIAIFIGSMGALFAALWHHEIKNFLPYFASGYVVWIFFSTMLSESCTTFTVAEPYMKQIALPYSFYAFLGVSRNLMVFFHQLVVFLIVALIFHVPFTHNTWLVIPGLILFCLNCSWIAIALGLLCARLRDVQQIVTSILQITMFVTPIFWVESQLGTGRLAWFILNLNPIYHLISIVRYPLLGEQAHLISWIFDVVMLLVGWSFTMFFLERNYNKLVYWL